MFFVVILAILAVVFGYPAWRLQSALAPPPWLAAGWTIATVLLALLPLAYLTSLRTGRLPPAWQRPLAWVTYLGLGAAVVLFDVVVLRDLTVAAAHALGSLGLAVEAGAWAGLSARLCLPGAALVSLYAVQRAARQPPVRHREVRVDGLPADLEGLRIAHVSDLHVGETIRRPFVERVVAAVAGLEPDLIAFTGDLADGRVDDLRRHVEPLAGLRAPLGVWFCSGNHDYYWDAAAWMDEVARLGLRLVSNDHGVVTRGSARLVIGGLPDPAGAEALPADPRHRPDVDAVFAGAPTGFRLLLAHQPALAVAAAAAGADLTLSGHTHGGQILPWSLLVRLQQPIVAGLRRRPGGGWIHVTHGAGYWGPPMRLGSPSEIACLTLRRA